MTHNQKTSLKQNYCTNLPVMCQFLFAIIYINYKCVRVRVSVHVCVFLCTNIL